MSIYIEGMDMPATCGKCKIKNIIECDRWKRVRSVALDRHRECPLIPVPDHGDLIDKNQAIDALWKALYSYEDKTEKQFIDDPNLDVSDWILHRIFVQNMNDTDRQIVSLLPAIIPAEQLKEE